MANILLAEDDLAVRDFVRLGLETEGHQVVAVHDGAEALLRLKADEIQYDLVLADIRMPVTNGLLLVQQMQEENYTMPILLMTGFDDQKEQALNLSPQVKGVIIKPFTLELIREEVSKVLAQTNKDSCAA